MMRKIIVVALALFASQASASDPVLVCLFKPTGERFNIVSMDGGDYIQWGTGKFEGVVSKFEDPYLTIKQYGRVGTFIMIYDAPKGIGYGGVKTFDGREMKGEILCATQ